MQQTNREVSLVSHNEQREGGSALGCPQRWDYSLRWAEVQTNQLKTVVFQGSGSGPVSVRQPTIKYVTAHIQIKLRVLLQNFTILQ